VGDMHKTTSALAVLLISLSTYASVDEGIAAYNEGNYATALEHFKEAAERGDPAGKHLLASLYYQGHGVAKDVQRAVALFTEAADAGFRPSQANLALMYSVGDGVQRDPAKAVAYGMRAAEAGDVQSQFNLGQAYRRRRRPGLQAGRDVVPQGS
jgi:TPR repeat protein